MLGVQHSHEPNEITAWTKVVRLVVGVTVCLSVCHSFYFRRAYRIQIFSSHLELDRGPDARAGAGVPEPGGRRIHGSSKTTWFTIPRRFPSPRPRRRPQWPGPPHEALLNSAMNKSGRGKRREGRGEEGTGGGRGEGNWSGEVKACAFNFEGRSVGVVWVHISANDSDL